jgi:lipoprotein signal peptidase
MMTRKDYVATAEILSSYSNLIDKFTFEDLVYDFSDMFFSDNPKFNPMTFKNACYVNDVAE